MTQEIFNFSLGLSLYILVLNFLVSKTFLKLSGNKLALVVFFCYLSEGQYLLMQFFGILALVAKTYLLPQDSVLRIKEEILGQGLYKIVSFGAKQIGYSGPLPGPKKLLFMGGTGSLLFGCNAGSAAQRQYELKAQHDMISSECLLMGPDHVDYAPKLVKLNQLSHDFPLVKGVVVENITELFNKSSSEVSIDTLYL